MKRWVICLVFIGLVIAPAGCDLFETDTRLFLQDAGPVLFLSRNIKNEWKLFSMEPDGTDVRKLTLLPSGYGIANAVWSPDGQKIALIVYGPGVGEFQHEVDLLGLTGLWVVDSRGIPIRHCPVEGQLLFARDHILVWSSDSRQILHGISEPYGRHHYVIDVSNCTSRLIGNSVSEPDSYPTFITDWSEDGLILLGYTDYSFPSPLGGSTRNIQVTRFDLDGDSLGAVGRVGQEYERPIWSSGERDMAVTIRDDAGRYLFRVSNDGTQLVQLTGEDNPYPEAVAWSSDDSQILIGSRRRNSGTPAIFLVESDGSGETDINPAADGINIPVSWRVH